MGQLWPGGRDGLTEEWPGSSLRPVRGGWWGGREWAPGDAGGGDVDVVPQREVLLPSSLSTGPARLNIHGVASLILRSGSWVRVQGPHVCVPF